jgi:hypothetical protein
MNYGIGKTVLGTAANAAKTIGKGTSSIGRVRPKIARLTNGVKKKPSFGLANGNMGALRAKLGANSVKKTPEKMAADIAARDSANKTKVRPDMRSEMIKRMPEAKTTTNKYAGMKKGLK